MMYCLSYDLHNPQRDYDRVIDAIGTLGDAREVDESVWILDSPYAPADVRDAVSTAADGQATVFVIELIKNWAAPQDRP